MPSRLLYSGPPPEVLYREYAARGRVDRDAQLLSTASRIVGHPPERVWELLADPPGWPSWAATCASPRSTGLCPGARFRWRLNGVAIRSRLRRGPAGPRAHLDRRVPVVPGRGPARARAGRGSTPLGSRSRSRSPGRCSRCSTARPGCAPTTSAGSPTSPPPSTPGRYGGPGRPASEVLDPASPWARLFTPLIARRSTPAPAPIAAAVAPASTHRPVFDLDVTSTFSLSACGLANLPHSVGVSTRTVRHYHHLGLLPSPRRVNGYREYRLRDAVLLARIRRLAELGLSLDEIRDVLADDERRELRRGAAPARRRPRSAAGGDRGPAGPARRAAARGGARPGRPDIAGRRRVLRHLPAEGSRLAAVDRGLLTCSTP